MEKHTRMLLIWLLNRIRSSRRLETETRRNIEVMWLMEKVTPDDKTICDFHLCNVVEPTLNTAPVAFLLCPSFQYSIARRRNSIS